ncbi:MAG: hypothetical protein HRU35_00980 [Rickettsiaceae bacterium]|nr:hypothetical protein [Rickettsiaceae bacterium]
MSNRLTSKGDINNKNVFKIPIGMVAKYPSKKLFELLTVANKELDRAKKASQWIEAAISLRFQERVQAKRMRLSKNTGVVHVEEDDFRFSSDIPKKVVWHQSYLARVVNDLKASGHNSSDYVDIIYKISENKYSSWPNSLQEIFKPARTVKVGNPTCKLICLKKDV